MDLNRIDLLVLLKIAVLGDEPWTQSSLAQDLRLAQSQVHASLKRSASARLYNAETKRVQRQALSEFLVHGVKYSFPAVRGGETRGVPTSYAAPPLCDEISATLEAPPVWPHHEGKVRGLEFQPLDKHAPEAALRDDNLYRLLTLVDAIRDGRARESKIATVLLREILSTTA